jgi:hypothetical protein
MMSQKDETGQAVPLEGFIDLPDGDMLVDDPDRIAQYRAVVIAEGLQEGTPEEVLAAWQWLSNHPEVTNRLEEWFRRRVGELKEMGRIK